MFYVDLSYRGMEEWLLATDQVQQALGLQDVPDHTTLYRAYRRLRLPQLDRLRQALLADLKPEEDVRAADATCYRLTNAIGLDSGRGPQSGMVAELWLLDQPGKV
jgi:hypothetical protein